MRERKLFLAAIAALVCFGSAHAETSAQQKRARVFASLPNWTGIWEAEAWTQRTAAGRPAGGMTEVRAKSQLMGHPPYNAAWEAWYQAGMKNLDALRATEATRKICSFGFPMGMESPSLFQVVLTPEEALFVFVTQDVRHVYTDGRPHAPQDELWPTRMGDSIGHWEGQTLVIETIARLATTPIAMASPMSKVSEKAKFTERIRMVSRDVLENEMTIDDPVAFTRPWTVKIRYHRASDLVRMTNHDCTENDRNPVVDGKLSVSPRN
jgi:hypothetical protein